MDAASQTCQHGYDNSIQAERNGRQWLGVNQVVEPFATIENAVLRVLAYQAWPAAAAQ